MENSEKTKKMENSEKTKKMENSEKIKYFTKIVERIGGKVVSTSDLYKIINDTDKEFGIDSEKLKCRYSKVTNRLMVILGSSIETIPDETKKRIGRQDPKLYSLKVDDLEGMNKIKSNIVSHFKISSVKKKKETGLSPRKYSTNKNFLMRFWNLLSIIKKEGLETVSFQKIKEIGGLSLVCNSVISSWKDSLKCVGVDLNYKIIDGVGSKSERRYKLVQFIGLNNTIFQLASVINRVLPDKKVSAESLLGIDNKKKLIPTTQVSTDKVSNFVVSGNGVDEAYLIYAAGGIIQADGGKRVDIDILSGCLRKAFDINESKNQLISILKKVDFFEILDYGRGVKLKDEKSWGSIKEIYGPQNFKKVSLVRLGMSESEVKKIVPGIEVELVSSISEFDGIYKLTYDMSVHSRKELMKLYRTFRQNDKFLNDEVLVGLLEREIEIIDGKSYKENLAYQIENI